MARGGANPIRPPLPRGALLETLRLKREVALHGGALQPIPTRERLVREGDLELILRVVENLGRKDLAGCQAAGQGEQGPDGLRPNEPAARAEARDPFLPYEEALFVADITETHVALLNKYNVVDEHLLLVTREFERQESPLGQEDFEALCRCLVEYPSLGFYNCGVLAGASQPHKHLQLVPLPLGPHGLEVPISPLLAGTAPEGAMERPGRVSLAPGLPFRHAISRLGEGLWRGSTAQAARELVSRYLELLGALGRLPQRGPEGWTCPPYNLLCTREWMLVVPRENERFEGVSLNSLAFAGCFLVRDDAEAELLLRAGPMRALISAAGAR